MIPLLLVDNPRAIALGMYPRDIAMEKMRRLVSAEMLGSFLRARETVDFETPAIREISAVVGMASATLGRFFLVEVSDTGASPFVGIIDWLLRMFTPKG